ncbi:MAG: RNA methyltransferase [Bacteroidetes bacterium]|nr:RNA methyltransferase [Bacteroidota bacterium]MDA0874275.1 RNA methyltransferase [Bacteroidota bacterium]
MPRATARQLKETADLSRKKHRDGRGCFLVEGVRSVQSALDAGASLVSVFLTPEFGLPAPLERRLQAQVELLEVSERDMARLSDVTTPPGVLAVVRKPTEPDASETAPRALLLDGVQDPGNVGTLIRTAAWMGVNRVLIGPGTADPYSPKVVRATMGGIWDVELVTAVDPAAWIGTARSHGATAWVADMDGTPAEAWSPAEPSVLVIGSEANGPSAAVRAACDGAVSIPLRGAQRGVESLNAAVAGAILMERWTAS